MSGKTIVLVPCYRRPEYTKMCIESLESAQVYKETHFYLVDDGSHDETLNILSNSILPKTVVMNNSTKGLRNVILDFFKVVKDYKYMVKMDNDCTVPTNWLREIEYFLDTGWFDIISPNVQPSNAAFKFGTEEQDDKPGVRPSKTVGGLWAMRTEMIKDIHFETIQTSRGISGAYSLLNQIILEKEPTVGWLPTVIVEDIGHWSGSHPSHIKSNAHHEYSVEVGRQTAW